MRPGIVSKLSLLEQKAKKKRKKVTQKKSDITVATQGHELGRREPEELNSCKDACIEQNRTKMYRK